MKKLTSIMMILLWVICLSIPAFATDTTSTGTSATETTSVIVTESTYQEQSSNTSGVTNYRNGEAGRGTVEDATEYWETNGYPDYVSYAYDVGGAVLSEDVIVSYWEIGVVDADDDMKQAILDLLAPTCLVTFMDCNYSYTQRITAYDEITALNDSNIVQVTMGTNTEMVHVILSGSLSLKQQQEYASSLTSDYGSFINIIDGTTSTTVTVATDDSFGVSSNSINSNLLRMIAFVICIGVLFLLVKKHRLALVAQTPNGVAVTQSGKPTGKAVVEAIRKSEVKPAEDTFKQIMEKAAIVSEQNRPLL